MQHKTSFGYEIWRGAFDFIQQNQYSICQVRCRLCMKQQLPTLSSMAAPRLVTRGRRNLSMTNAWSRAAIIATVMAGLLAATMVANFFVIQSYERILSQYTYYPMAGTSRSLLQLYSPAGDNFRVDGATNAEQSLDCSQPIIRKPEPDGLKMAWLMSFPNSGTSFTSRLVRDATKTDSASNYADETPSGENGLRLPVYEDQPDGPFWIKPEASPEFQEPTEYVITKTHCGIRCTMCPPEKYAESSYSFRRKCFKTKWMDVHADGTKERVFSEYKSEKLTKAIHLVRDPFDNIVSRYHLERKLPGRLAANYPKTRDGFRAYCQAIDDLHKTNEKRALFLDDDVLEIMSIVPCHADFFRYIEWHNLAFATTRDLELQEYVLLYDWFTTRFNETAKELLEFLKLPIHEKGDLTPFIAGKVYPYFTVEEKLAVQKAFEIMSSPVTWKHVQHYFDNIHDESTFNADSVSGDELVSSAADGLHTRPPLNTLVKDDSATEITGDVQWLMDFAIVGYPKTATSTKVRWLAAQKEIQMYDHEIYHLKDGRPADMVRELYALPEGSEYKRGYKAPRDIHNVHAVEAFQKYWPSTKFIVGLRHPVLWFESFYNFRIRFNYTLPTPDLLMDRCPPTARNVCLEEIRYQDHLSRLGKTPRTDPEELKLLGPIPWKDDGEDTPRKMENPVFLYEISQMHETDESLAAQYRQDLQTYLGLATPLEPMTEVEELHGDHPNKDKEINICAPEHSVAHDALLQVARDSSLWIRNYFLPLPDVFVSSPDHFHALLEDWMNDPCDRRQNIMQHNSLVSSV